MHVNELMSSMPKTCLLYNFIYACFGELPAFFTAWTALLDFIIILVIIAKSWSDHTVSTIFLQCPIYTSTKPMVESIIGHQRLEIRI